MSDTKDDTTPDTLEEVEQSGASVSDAPVGVEVAARSADQPSDDTTEFRKDFVLRTIDYTVGNKARIHENNENTVRQTAINQGLRIVGDIKHRTSKHKDDDGASTSLIYTAEAVPAHNLEAGDEFNNAPANPDSLDPAE